MNKNCAGCGKPVYFAERKTSLGREWHPSCLKCTQCGKVLSPGQHAEHKGAPYCHHPCYRALFGPAILGYGSNISSPANFAPRREGAGGIAAASNPNRASTGSIVKSVESEDSQFHSLSRRNRPSKHLVHHNSNGLKRELFSSRSCDSGGSESQSVAPQKLAEVQSPRSSKSPSVVDNEKKTSTPLVQRAASQGTLPLFTSRSGTPPAASFIDPHSSSSSSPSTKHPAPSVTSTSGLSQPSTEKQRPSNKLQEMLDRLHDFNKYYDGKVHSQMTAKEQGDGRVFVEGPLRIYWGLSRPIQLAHCDNIPPAPISQWRHSLHVGADSPVDNPKKSLGSMSFRGTGSPARKSRDLDDLLSPTSPDDVVRRKKGGVRKFKTVAYRGGDQPSKWKRASINGHIFNFDTSVFTPVLGSCTSVTVDSTLNSLEVIETLLDKFKVQNNADEYVLSIVNEEGERWLTNQERPLLERLKLGPDEAVGKIFIKEREVHQEDGVGELVVSTLPGGAAGDMTGENTTAMPAAAAEFAGGGGSGAADSAGIRRSRRSASIKMPIRETEEEENLPHEVEQLLVLPEAVLRGLLVKYHNDEEMDVKLVRARYDVVRRRITGALEEVLSHSTSSTA